MRTPRGNYCGVSAGDLCESPREHTGYICTPFAAAMDDLLDILHRTVPTLVSLLPTWLTVRFLVGSNRVPAGSRVMRWGRLALIVVIVTGFGVLSVLLFNLVWPGGETVGEWLRSTLPVMTISLLAVSSMERMVGAKRRPAR